MSFVNIAYAAISAENSTAGKLLVKATAAIVNPLIMLFFTGALCIFVWGIFQFIRGADNDQARSDGQKHMMWGLIGLFIMIATFAIIQLIISFVGDASGSTPNIWILKK